MGVTRTGEAGELARLFAPGAGVRLAFADGRVIALDVEADRYVRLTRALSKPVGDVLAAPALVGPVAALASSVLLKRRMDEIVRSFLRIRPLYPRDYQCFFDALALRHYLARRGIAASWVFGVRGAPFAAHCWLEFGGAVLNEEPDLVRAYQPIMIV